MCGDESETQEWKTAEGFGDSRGAWRDLRLLELEGLRHQLAEPARLEQKNSKREVEGAQGKLSKGGSHLARVADTTLAGKRGKGSPPLHQGAPRTGAVGHRSLDAVDGLDSSKTWMSCGIGYKGARRVNEKEGIRIKKKRGGGGRREAQAVRARNTAGRDEAQAAGRHGAGRLACLRRALALLTSK